MNTITRFPGISPVSWEHPADRAALATIQLIPGADLLTRAFVGGTSEKSMRLLILGQTARVGKTQFARIDRVADDVVTTFGWKTRPDVFVSQDPWFNAGAYGVEKPFIVLNTGALDLLDDRELTALVGHEFGHIMSGHALYKSIIWYLHAISWMALSQLPLAGLALKAIYYALLEWERKAELTADRAGLLSAQDPMASYGLLMKSAGGRRIEDMDLNEFFLQAREYDQANDLLGSLYKFLNTLDQSHPLPVVRMAELKTFEKSGYADILAGKYRMRDADEGQAQGDSRGFRAPDLEKGFHDWTRKAGDLRGSYDEAARQYRDDLSRSEDPLAGIMKNVGDGAGTLLRQADKAREQLGDFLNGLFRDK